MKNRNKTNRIKEVMIEHGLSQTQLAKDCGLSPQYISSVLSGRKNVSDSLLEKIAYNYDVSLNWLMVGVGTMKESEQTDSGTMTDDIDAVLGEFFAELIKRDESDAIKRAVYYLAKGEKK